MVGGPCCRGLHELSSSANSTDIRLGVKVTKCFMVPVKWMDASESHSSMTASPVRASVFSRVFVRPLCVVTDLARTGMP